MLKRPDRLKIGKVQNDMRVEYKGCALVGIGIDIACKIIEFSGIIDIKTDKRCSNVQIGRYGYRHKADDASRNVLGYRAVDGGVIRDGGDKLPCRDIGIPIIE